MLSTLIYSAIILSWPYQILLKLYWLFLFCMSISDHNFLILRLTACGGIVTQAAAGTTFLILRSYASTAIRNSRRQALLLFLFFGILWAFSEFIGILLPVQGSTACLTTVVLTTAFDQLTRITFDQYLLWYMGSEVKPITTRLLLYGVLFIRVLAGGVFLGFTRVEFSPKCPARRSNLIVSILVLSLDSLIIFFLLIRMLVMVINRSEDIEIGQRIVESRAFIFSIIGFIIWSGTSVPMILGLPILNFLSKTISSAIGLLIFIWLITVFSEDLVSSSLGMGTTADAPSSFLEPILPSQNHIDSRTRNGSPNSLYLQIQGLYVVNPSNTPRDSDKPFSFGRGIMKVNDNESKEPISSISEKTGFDFPFKLTSRRMIDKTNQEDSDTDISQLPNHQTPGYRGSSGIFPTQGNNHAALAPAIIGDTRTKIASPSETSSTASPIASFLKWHTKNVPHKQSIRNLPISGPIITENDQSSSRFLVKIPTIDLDQAIINDNKRRDAAAAAARSRLSSNPIARVEPSFSGKEQDTRDLEQQMSTKMDLTASSNLKTDIAYPMPIFKDDRTYNDSIYSTEDEYITPTDEVIDLSKFENEKTITTSTLPASSYSPNPGLLSLVEYQKPLSDSWKLSTGPEKTVLFSSQLNLMDTVESQAEKMNDLERVMFMDNITYNDPDAVNEIKKQVSEKYDYLPEASQSKSRSPDHLKKDSSNCLTPIIQRPRPIQRKIDTLRTMGRRRSKSLFTPRSKPLFPPYSFVEPPINNAIIVVLPPHPPLPTRAANLKRLLREDTESINYEEKIEYLFPAPPEVPKKILKPRRHTSLPCLRITPVYQELSLDLVSSESSEIPEIRLMGKTETYIDSKIADERPKNVHIRINPFIGSESGDDILLIEKLHVRSESVNVVEKEFVRHDQSDFTPIESIPNIKSRDIDSDDWKWLAEQDPLHSEDLETRSRANILNTIPLGQGEKIESKNLTIFMPDSESLSEDEVGGLKLSMGVTSLKDDDQQVSNDFRDSKASTLVDGLENRVTGLSKQDLWNSQFGKSTHGFSGRRLEFTKTDKISYPLHLSINNSLTKSILSASEPTPPPDMQYVKSEDTQSDLLKPRKSKPKLTNSLIDKLSSSPMIQSDRQAFLFEELEKEIEEQTDRWQYIQSNLDRDSLTVTPGFFKNNTISTSILHQEPEKESLKIDLDSQIKFRDSNISISSSLSRDFTTETWQQQLAEVQESYITLYNQESNRLTISNIVILSPTPPQSISPQTISGFDFDADDKTSRPIDLSPNKKINMLWSPKVDLFGIRSGHTRKSSVLSRMYLDTEPQAKDLRPAKRYLEDNLSIYSHNLWVKTPIESNNVPDSGLWTSNIGRRVSGTI